jgi:predicted O-methyltransferase YrrM
MMRERLPRDEEILRALDRAVDELGAVGWCRPAERHLLYHLARSGPGAGAIVELGSWKGLSTIYLAAGSKQGGRERVTAIDPFSPERHVEFHKNLLGAGVADWVRPHVAESVAAARDWDGGPIRLLYIDALHTYPQVRQDYEAWYPLVAPGGLIAFHDALEPNHPDVSRFLDELLPGDHWSGCHIVHHGPAALPGDADSADPLVSSIVVVEKRGGRRRRAAAAPFALGQGAFATIRDLIAQLREQQGAIHRLQSGGAGAGQPATPGPIATAAGDARGAGSSGYDRDSSFEHQFHAAEEYALELEERLEQVEQDYRALQRDHARLAAANRALDSALRAANPVKNRLRARLGRRR